MRLFTLALAAAAVLLGGSPAWATWRRAESPNFILFSQASEDKVREQAALLEDYHAFLRMLTGVKDPPAPNKLRVYLVRGRGQLRQVRDVGPNVAGFYTATTSGIAAFVDDRSGGWGGDDQILFHEIAHHFMMQYRPSAYPAWFIEGFAEYAMTARFRDNAIEFGHPSENRIAWLRNARWLPWDKVLFEGVPRGQESALFYGQSWLLAHFLLRDDSRREKFRIYLQAIAAGTPPRKAFEDQFGELRAFGRAVENYAARQMTFTRVTRASAAAAPQVKLEALPRAADELLLADANMYVGVGKHHASAFLERVRTEAARHAGDGYAKRILAKAEALYGDAAKGEKLIDEMIAAQPNDAELLYVKGMRHLREGRSDPASRAARFRQARPWFVRAHKLDKYHFPTLASYAESLTTEQQFNSENTLEIVLLARELAPQVLELNMNAASLLLLRGHFAEAESVLRPIASNPHNAAIAAAAQIMLEAARNKQRMPSSAPPKAAGE